MKALSLSIVSDWRLTEITCCSSGSICVCATFRRLLNKVGDNLYIDFIICLSSGYFARILMMFALCQELKCLPLVLFDKHSCSSESTYIIIDLSSDHAWCCLASSSAVIFEVDPQQELRFLLSISSNNSEYFQLNVSIMTDYGVFVYIGFFRSGLRLSFAILCCF